MSERIDVDPAIMQAAADAPAASAQTLHTGLSELDAEVVEMLGSWQGAAGHAYAQGWQQWRIGAQHVQSVLAGISECRRRRRTRRRHRAFHRRDWVSGRQDSAHPGPWQQNVSRKMLRSLIFSQTQERPA